MKAKFTLFPHPLVNGFFHFPNDVQILQQLIILIMKFIFHNTNVKLCFIFILKILQLVVGCLYFHTHINYVKIIQGKNFNRLYNYIPWNFAFRITIYFFLKWKCLQRSQTFIYILTKRKVNKKFPKVYTSHGSPCNSTCTLM
jgi:hypothetical protein